MSSLHRAELCTVTSLNFGFILKQMRRLCPQNDKFRVFCKNEWPKLCIHSKEEQPETEQENKPPFGETELKNLGLFNCHLPSQCISKRLETKWL
jgi:hypothetical protein